MRGNEETEAQQKHRLSQQFNALSGREQRSVDLQAERRRASNDLFYLCRNILGYDALVEHYHRPICSSVTRYRDQDQLHLHPRGHFKSTIITIGGSIQKTLRDPNTRGLITNATLGKAKTFLGEIEAHFNRNPVFARLFPEHVPTKASGAGTQSEFTTPARTRFQLREPTFSVSGIESAVVSSHYDWIIFDDIVNKENAKTAEQRLKVIEALAEYQSLLDPPHDQHTIVGTRWHYMDVYGAVIKTDKELVKLGENPLYIKFLTQDLKNRSEGYDLNDEEAEPSFPERFTVEHLRKLKARQKKYIYNCQYCNDPQPAEDKVFRVKDLQIVQKPHQAKETRLYKYTTLDPTVGETETSDNAVIITVAINSDGDLFIVGFRRGQWNPDQHISEFLSELALHRPRQSGIEAVAFQTTLKFFVEKEKRRRNIKCEIVGIKRSTHTRKEGRIERIQPFLEGQKIYWAIPIVDEQGETLPEAKENLDLFTQELDQFPFGDSDDILDALADAVELAMANPLPKKLPKRKIVYEECNGTNPYRTGYRHRARSTRARQVS